MTMTSLPRRMVSTSITESKTPVGASAMASVAPAPIGSTAATLECNTCAQLFVASTTSSAAAVTMASPALDSMATSSVGSATDLASSSADTSNAALLPFILPSSGCKMKVKVTSRGAPTGIPGRDLGHEVEACSPLMMDPPAVPSLIRLSTTTPMAPRTRWQSPASSGPS